MPYSKIIVNTDQLRAKASQLGELSGRVEEVSSELSSIISRVDANAYEGQLRKQVRAILDDAQARAAGLATNLKELQGELTDRAERFEKANTVIKLAFGLLTFVATLAIQRITVKKEQDIQASSIILDRQTTNNFAAPLTLRLNQTDNRWKDTLMGENNLTIGEVGCLLVAVTMVARFNGVDVMPSNLNNYLRETRGGIHQEHQT